MKISFLRFLVFALALCMALPALAQQQQPRMSAGQEATALAYRQLGLAIDQMHAEDATLRKRFSEMDEYLKKCGDQPGCTSPVAPQAK